MQKLLDRARAISYTDFIKGGGDFYMMPDDTTKPIVDPGAQAPVADTGMPADDGTQAPTPVAPVTPEAPVQEENQGQEDQGNTGGGNTGMGTPPMGNTPGM